MPRLQIHVFNDNGQTVSKFGKANDNEKIVFINEDAGANLTVTIIGDAAGKALCKPSGQKEAATFTVDPGGKSKAYTVCNDFQGTAFKYSAQVGTATVEDPMIIIERGIHPPSTISNTVAALLVVGAFVVGLLTARLFMRGRPTTPP